MKKILNFFKLKTIMSKIILAFVICGIIMIIASGSMVITHMYDQEVTLVEDIESISTNYMHDYVGDGDWEIRDHQLWKGDTCVGDCTEENANKAPFIELEEKTGVFFYSFMKIDYVDPEIKAACDATSDHFSDYLRVAGSTLDAKGNSIVGTYMDKAVSDQLLTTDVVKGEADVQGRAIYCIYSKIFDAEGNTIGCLVVGRSMEELNGQAYQAAWSVIFVITGVLVAATIGLILIIYNWIKALKKSQKYLSELGKGNFSDKPLTINTHDEMSDMAATINDMAKSLKEKERIAAELNLAANIQANMLPSIFPAFPANDEFDIFARMTPAKEVGGDFYDMFMIDSHRLVVVMADVSGKGIPAALFMVIAKTLIKNQIQSGLEPGSAFTKVNQMLCEGNDQGLFVTGWAAVINLKNGEVIYANAGHNPPVLIHEGEPKFIKGKIGFVLAGMEGIRYKPQEFHMDPGDKLFLYTDGVTEATDIKGELYGDDRLMNFFKNCDQSKEVKDICVDLRADIDAFVGEAEQFDDITMLLVEYKHETEDDGFKEIIVPAVDEELSNIQEFLEEQLEAADCPMKTSMLLSVAIEELFVNVCHYAYGEGSGKVRFSIKVEDGIATMKMSDRGMPFNPLAKADPDITLSAEQRKIGGLGIFMVKKTMDSIKYEYQAGRNVVTMKKDITK